MFVLAEYLSYQIVLMSKRIICWRNKVKPYGAMKTNISITVKCMHTLKKREKKTRSISCCLFSLSFSYCTCINTYDRTSSATIRQPSLYIPTSVHSTATEFSQDVEPTYATISSNMRTAWVTLPVTSSLLIPFLYHISGFIQSCSR